MKYIRVVGALKVSITLFDSEGFIWPSLSDREGQENPSLSEGKSEKTEMKEKLGLIYDLYTLHIWDL